MNKCKKKALGLDKFRTKVRIKINCICKSTIKHISSYYNNG